ncbi:MAG: polysaccharide deacetylase family protein [Anaerolineae bacterium]
MIRPRKLCFLLTGGIWIAWAIALAGCITAQSTAFFSTPAQESPIRTSPLATHSVIAPTITVATATGTPSATPAATKTLTATATASLTGTPTVTSLPSATPTPTATFTPGPTPDGISRELRVPILMYHYISTPPADADIYRRDLAVAPERFESHLQYLRQAGYQSITLDDLLYGLAQGRALPEKPVILTFDDGYEDNYTNAFPLLQRYGMIGHFFIISDFVNQGRKGYMSWPQIEEMAAAGQRFGSHSRDHPNLKDKSVDYLVWQALGGKESIEEHLGYHPRWISYPAGSYDQQVITVYRSAGYWGGLTTQQGATHTLANIFELKRVRVRGTHTAEHLAALLALAW